VKWKKWLRHFFHFFYIIRIFAAEKSEYQSDDTMHFVLKAFTKK